MYTEILFYVLLECWPILESSSEANGSRGPKQLSCSIMRLEPLHGGSWIGSILGRDIAALERWLACRLATVVGLFCSITVYRLFFRTLSSLSRSPVRSSNKAMARLSMSRLPKPLGAWFNLQAIRKLCEDRWTSPEIPCGLIDAVKPTYLLQGRNEI